MTEITDEQRAAWRNFEDYYPSAAQKLAPLLPSKLTNQQPVLPNEPGRYESQSGDSGWLLDARGQWSYDGDEAGLATEPEQYGPFTRLVPEREFDMEEIINAYESAPYGEGWDAVNRVLNGDNNA